MENGTADVIGVGLTDCSQMGTVIVKSDTFLT